MFQNLHMLDGIAICEDYEPSFLDNIKIDSSHYLDARDKPTHINKLFEHEDEFMDQSNVPMNSIDRKNSIIQDNNLGFTGCLDPAQLIEKTRILNLKRRTNKYFFFL